MEILPYISIHPFHKEMACYQRQLSLDISEQLLLYRRLRDYYQDYDFPISQELACLFEIEKRVGEREKGLDRKIQIFADNKLTRSTRTWKAFYGTC